MGLAAGYEAWLITVGNEVLIGKVVNTNMAWLGRKLTLLGYKVCRALVVPDELDDIAWAFRAAVEAGVKVVISTGGLGPTFDDKTAEGLALALGSKLVLNEKALEMVREKYESEGLKLTQHRVKMAILPEGAEPLPNPVGTAPGIHVKVGKTEVFCLPGVPKEMEAIFEESVEPYLKAIGPKIVFVERMLEVRGLPESGLAPLVEEVVKKFGVYVKSHPRGAELKVPIILLHITSSGSDEREAEKKVERALEYFKKTIVEKGGRVEEKTPENAH